MKPLPLLLTQPCLGLFDSGPYLENLLPEILLILQASNPTPTPVLLRSLERKTDKIKPVGDGRWVRWEILSQSWILPALFRKGPRWRISEEEEEKKKKAPPMDTGCPVGQTPARGQPGCPFPSKIVFKIQPSTFKNLSLISNSNKRTAWWLLFCFLLPNSSLWLHNKSV